uniref:PH domain-containing protein n=1 Tax=Parastrongyloides trichosuri TaxID=131310 RepID=A0A0N4ZQ98_PARTI
MRIKDEEEGTCMSKSSIVEMPTKNDKEGTKNLSSSKSFRDKLSKSFFDLTHGSQDRLQRWKSKLQSGKKSRDKDTSCPPPKERLVTFDMPSTSSHTSLTNHTTGQYNNKDIPFTFLHNSFNNEKNYLNVRPLHTSKSLNNAISVFDGNKIPRNGLIKSSSFREPCKIKRTSSSTNFDSSSKTFINISPNNKEIAEKFRKESPILNNTNSEDMEHRTLRVRDNNSINNTNIMQRSMKNNIYQEPSTQHEKNMKSLHNLVKTIESYSNNGNKNDTNEYHLPPPARIMPYSGIKPQDNAIIRPIAFRPIGTSEPGTVQKHFSITNKQAPKIDIQSTNQNYSNNNMKTSPNSRDSYASAIQDNHTTNTSKGNPPPYQASFAPSRPKPLTVNGISLSNYSQQQHNQQQSKEENDYDTVAEYIIDKDNRICSDGSETYSYLPNNNNQKHTYTTATSSSGNMTSSTHSNSMKSIGSRSPGSTSQQNLINQPQITPSPSDSGIVDYETLIKDKENELNNVRQTMEQNEEILVRVYQEKEKSFRHEMSELKQKLKASQQGENALRNQLIKSEEERERLNEIVNNLQNDKISMSKKCSQIEKELYAMKSRIQEMATEKLINKSKQQNGCDQCRLNKGLMTGSYMNDGNLQKIFHTSPPIPAPRQSRENVCSDNDLRNEVDALRSEISSLREQLFEQFSLMNNDRRRDVGEVNGNNNRGIKTITNSFSTPINGNNIKKPIISGDRLI